MKTMDRGCRCAQFFAEWGMFRRDFFLPALALLLGLPAIAQQAPKLESYLILPEPKAMGSATAISISGAQRTVFSPAHEVAESPGIKAYSVEEFTRLGISKASFMERAAALADKRLATMQPEFIKDETGKTRYAVYRGESSLMASLLIAPSLGKTFEALFGEEVWAAAPDRNALYIFPAKPESLAEFSPDLNERYEGNPYAVSCEIFLLKKGEKTPRVVATFGE
jgi:hypothetical protein